MMGKFFNTEHECFEHEQKINAEKVRNEKLKREQKERYDKICKHHKLLMDEIHSFENDYKSHVFSERYYDDLSQIIAELSRLLT